MPVVETTMFRIITRNKQHVKNIFYRSYVTPVKQVNNCLAVYPEMIDTIFESDLFKQVPQHTPHFVKILDYNVSKSKNSIFLDTYKILEKKEDLTDEKLRLANILSWCLELIWTYMNISDDVIHQNEHRCNKICWHKNENIGLNAYNDAVFVYETVFIVLKKYFSNTPMYLRLYNLFHHMHVNFIIGQTRECNLKKNGKPEFSKFNGMTYMTLSRYKNGFSRVEAPYQLAHILSQKDDCKKMKDVLAEISYLYQINQDIHDVFQNEKLKKSEAQSVRQGQCTWMAVQVLEHGSSDLIKTFTTNYGRPKPECVEKVIDVYLQMNLYGKYVEYKKKALNDVKQIDALTAQVLQFLNEN